MKEIILFDLDGTLTEPKIGITKSVHGKSGPHSLRHALASNMLAEHVPIHIISAVLGHSSSNSTMVYLHSNVEGLRQCALDVVEG